MDIVIVTAEAEAPIIPKPFLLSESLCPVRSLPGTPAREEKGLTWLIKVLTQKPPVGTPFPSLEKLQSLSYTSALLSLHGEQMKAGLATVGKAASRSSFPRSVSPSGWVYLGPFWGLVTTLILLVCFGILGSRFRWEIEREEDQERIEMETSVSPILLIRSLPHFYHFQYCSVFASLSLLTAVHDFLGKPIKW